MMQPCFLARLLQQAIGPSTTWFCLAPFQNHSNSHTPLSTKISSFYRQCSKRSISSLLYFVTPGASGSYHFSPGQVLLTDLSISLPQFPFTAVRTRHWLNLQVLHSTDVAGNYHCSARLLQLISLISIFACPFPCTHLTLLIYFLFFPLQFMHLWIHIYPDFSLFFVGLICVPYLWYISAKLCGSERIFLVLSHCLRLQISYPWLGLKVTFRPITRIMWRSTYNQLPPQSINNPLHFS